MGEQVRMELGGEGREENVICIYCIKIYFSIRENKDRDTRKVAEVDS